MKPHHKFYVEYCIMMIKEMVVNELLACGLPLVVSKLIVEKFQPLQHPAAVLLKKSSFYDSPISTQLLLMAFRNGIPQTWQGDTLLRDYIFLWQV